MMQGIRASETRRRRYGIENPEGTDVQDETLKCPECKIGKKNPDTRRQLCLKIKRTSQGINR
jgi:hypothetical protein